MNGTQFQRESRRKERQTLEPTALAVSRQLRPGPQLRIRQLGAAAALRRPAPAPTQARRALELDGEMEVAKVAVVAKTAIGSAQTAALLTLREETRASSAA